MESFLLNVCAGSSARVHLSGAPIRGCPAEAVLVDVAQQVDFEIIVVTMAERCSAN